MLGNRWPALEIPVERAISPHKTSHTACKSAGHLSQQQLIQHPHGYDLTQRQILDAAIGWCYTPAEFTLDLLKASIVASVGLPGCPFSHQYHRAGEVNALLAEE